MSSNQPILPTVRKSLSLRNGRDRWRSGPAKGWPDTYGVWRVPTSGGKESLVVDSPHPTGGWVVVEDGIYFVSKPDETGVSHIRFKDLATDSDRIVVPIEAWVFWGLTVSPDRRTFLYTIRRLRQRLDAGVEFLVRRAHITRKEDNAQILSLRLSRMARSPPTFSCHSCVS